MKINPGNARGLPVPQGDRPFSFVVYSSEIRDFGEKANGISTSKEIDEKLKTIIQNYNKHLPDNLFTRSNVQEAISNARLRVRNGHAAQTQVYELIEHLLELAPTMTDTTP